MSMVGDGAHESGAKIPRDLTLPTFIKRAQHRGFFSDAAGIRGARFTTP